MNYISAFKFYPTGKKGRAIAVEKGFEKAFKASGEEPVTKAEIESNMPEGDYDSGANNSGSSNSKILRKLETEGRIYCVGKSYGTYGANLYSKYSYSLFDWDHRTKKDLPDRWNEYCKPTGNSKELVDEDA